VFPAFEIYVMPDGGGETRTLLQRYPDPGVTPVDLTFSQLAISVFAQTRLDNTTTCSDPNQVCCPIGTNNEQCCTSDKPVCCPNFVGGGCCEAGWGCCPPGVGGEHICCLPGWSCCESTQQALNGCCPPETRGCCPLDFGGGCCEPDKLCCNGDPPFCCPQDHPVCVEDRGLCGRPRAGVTAEHALATGQFESLVPAPRKQAARSKAAAALAPAGTAPKAGRRIASRTKAAVRPWRRQTMPKER